MAARWCEDSHCHDAQVLEVCKEIYGTAYAGKPVASRDSQGACKCKCSCLAYNTPIAISPTDDRVVQEFRARKGNLPGDTVLAAGTDLQWSDKEVLFSDGTAPGSRQPNAVFISYDNTYIVVTADHLFLMPDKSLRMANRLAVGDSLMGPTGDQKTITDIFLGDFHSGFHHIATSLGDPKGNLDEHLLVTNGVVSADYAVQLFNDAFLPKGHANLPELGSAAYEKKYNRKGIERVSASQNKQDMRFGLAAAGDFISRTAHSVADEPAPPAVFVPASETISQPPPEASPFISVAEAQAKLGDTFRSLTDLASRDEAEQLAFQFMAHYPDVEIDIDWYNNDVNAYAWGYSGQRRVSIKGGLLRHSALEWEGIALIMGHEIGHHYGGPPFTGSGGSCEGISDYYGAGVTMRRVWFVEQYLSVIEPAIDQLENFFAPNPGHHGCGHPSRDCRISIYNAAVELRAIPTCSTASP